MVSEVSQKVRDNLGVVLWPLAIASFVHTCLLVPAVHAVTSGQGAIDFEAPWCGAVLLLRQAAAHGAEFNDICVWPGHDGYVPVPYLPSVFLFLAPLGLLSVTSASLVFLTINLGAILLGTALSLRIFNQHLYSPAGAIALLALANAQPVYTTLDNGNINGIIVAAEALTLLAAIRSKWALAGLSLGVSLAIKPLLPVFLLLFALKRRYICLVLAIGLPIAMSSFVLLVNSDLALSSFHDIMRMNSAMTWGNMAIASFQGIAYAPALALRIAVLMVVGWLTWRRWCQPGDLALRLVEASGMLLLAMLLCAPFSERYHSVILIPLIVSTVRPEALMRSPIAWLGVYFVFTNDVWATTRFGDIPSLLLVTLPMLGYLLMLAGIGLGIVHREYQRLPPDTVRVPVAQAGL